MSSPTLAEPTFQASGTVFGRLTAIGASRARYFSGWRICSVESGGSANAASTAG